MGAYTINHSKTVNTNIVPDWAGTVTVADSAGSTKTINATELVRPVDWNSGHQFSLQLSASDIASLFNFTAGGFASTTGPGGITLQADDDYLFEPYTYLSATASVAPTIGAWYFAPFNTPQGMDSGHLRYLAINAWTAASNFQPSVGYTTTTNGTVTYNMTISNRFAIYSQETGGASTGSLLSKMWTGDNNISVTWIRTYSSSGTGAQTTGCFMTNAVTLAWPGSFDVSGGSTSSTTGFTGTSSTATTSMTSSFGSALISSIASYYSGSVMYSVPFATSLPPGQYYMGWMISTSTSSNGAGGGTALTAAAGSILSTAGLVVISQPVFTTFRKMSTTTGNSTSQAYHYQGSHTQVSSSAFGSVGTSDLKATNVKLYWYLARYTG